MTESRFTTPEVAALVVGFLGTGAASLLCLGLAAAALQSALQGDPQSLRMTSWLAASVGALAAAGAASLLAVATRSLSASRRIHAALRLCIALAVIGYAGALAGYDLELLPAPVAAGLHGMAFAGTTGLIVLVFLRSTDARRVGLGAFLHGMWIAPVLALTLEAILAVIGVVLAVAVFAVTDAGQIWLSTLPDPSALAESALDLERIAPLIRQPFTITLGVLGLTLFVPFLEEVLKALWLVPLAIFNRLQPRQGFIAGAIAGVGFGLAEAMFVTPPESGWSLVFLTRLGASLMHATTTGLVGWGIAELVAGRRWHRLLLGFAAAVAFHGLWNLGALGVATKQLHQVLPAESMLIQLSGVFAGLGIVLIGGLLLSAVLGLSVIIRYPRTVAGARTVGKGSPLSEA